MHFFGAYFHSVKRIAVHFSCTYSQKQKIPFHLSLHRTLSLFLSHQDHLPRSILPRLSCIPLRIGTFLSDAFLWLISYQTCSAVGGASLETVSTQGYLATVEAFNFSLCPIFCEMSFFTPVIPPPHFLPHLQQCQKYLTGSCAHHKLINKNAGKVIYEHSLECIVITYEYDFFKAVIFDQKCQITTVFQEESLF